MKVRMTKVRTTAVLALTGLLGACSTASGPSTTEPRLPPAQSFDAKIQPSRLSPNPQGAFGLSYETGCDVIYVMKAGAPDTVNYAVRPTSREPDAARCVELLRTQPGIDNLVAVN